MTTSTCLITFMIYLHHVSIWSILTNSSRRCVRAAPSYWKSIGLKRSNRLNGWLEAFEFKRFIIGLFSFSNVLSLSLSLSNKLVGPDIFVACNWISGLDSSFSLDPSKGFLLCLSHNSNSLNKNIHAYTLIRLKLCKIADTHK